MKSISRRGLVISAAAAGAAFGLDGPLEFITPSFAKMPEGAMLDKGFVTIKVGDIEVIQLYDGIWEKAHANDFVTNATTEQVKAQLKASGLTDAFVPIPFTVTAVKRKDKVVLFDSGTGGQLSPKAGLFASKTMKAAGIELANVSTIVVTHFHPDHVFGLMAKDTNAQLFPNAEIVVPGKEYKFWMDPANKSDPAKRFQAAFPGWKNMRQFDGDVQVVPGVRAIATPGHTPGHTSYHIASGKREMIILGDITNIPALFVTHPEWHAGFDTDGDMAEKTRRAIFSRAINDNAIVSGYHYGLPGAGKIKKDGKGYAFVPVSV